MKGSPPFSTESNHTLQEVIGMWMRREIEIELKTIHEFDKKYCVIDQADLTSSLITAVSVDAQKNNF
jgi:hypothetical protein